MQHLSHSAVKGALILAGFIAASSNAADLGNFGGTEVSFKGFLKMDAILSDFDSGTVSGSAREFYFPSQTPVGDGNQSENVTFDMHARQTRFAIATKSDVDGDTLKTYIEMDFMTTAGGNEVVSNSRISRLRHAFLEYNNWLFGQTWSTFMDVNALPETLDFIGNTDATVFIRQTQVRYTVGSFQFALENPESTIMGVGATDDNTMPDIVARYNLSAGDLSMVFAGLARQIEMNTAGSVDESTNGFGLSVSGVYKIGKDDIKFLVNTGSGMGRYTGLGISPDAVMDADGNLKAIDTMAYYASFRHFWNDKWRSTLSYSAIDIDNDTELTGVADTVSKDSSSVRLNLIYSPNARLSLGGELASAKRTSESGESGKLNRLQFSAKLTF